MPHWRGFTTYRYGLLGTERARHADNGRPRTLRPSLPIARRRAISMRHRIGVKHLSLARTAQDDVALAYLAGLISTLTWYAAGRL